MKKKLRILKIEVGKAPCEREIDLDEWDDLDDLKGGY